MSKSIVCDEDKKHCRICGSENNLNLHHIIYGKNRKNADKYGLTIWLCKKCHQGTYGVHGKYGHELDLKLKQEAEKCFLDYYNKEIEDFIDIFKINYL